MDLNNFLSDPTSELFKSSSKASGSWLRFLAPQQIVSRIEYLIQGNIAVAFLMDHKIKEFVPEHEGDESLWDGAIDEKGNWKEDVIKFNQYAEVVLKINQIKDIIQGQYDFRKTMLIKRTLGGRALMAYHTWVPSFIKVRFQSEREDPFTGVMLKGRYNTTWDLITGNLNENGIKTNLANIVKIYTKKAIQGEAFSAHDLSNIKSMIREISMLITLTAGKILLKGLGNLGDDDRYNDTNNFLIYYLLNTSAKLQNDLLTIPKFISSKDAQRNIIPLFSIVQQATDFMDSAGDILTDEDDGMDNLTHSIYGFIPGVTEIERAEKFLSKPAEKPGFISKAIYQ